MRTVQFKMVPARSSSSSSRTRTWTWIRTIATWHASLPACLLPACSRLFLLLSHSRYLSLSLLRFASCRSQTRLRGCYPYAVFFENRQPSLSCSALALVLLLVLVQAGPVCDAFISVADTWNVLEPKPQQSAAPPQRWGIAWWRWCGVVRMMRKLMIESGEAAHACTMMKLWAQKHLHSLCITFYFTVSLFSYFFHFHNFILFRAR